MWNEGEVLPPGVARRLAGRQGDKQEDRVDDPGTQERLVKHRDT